MIKLKIKPMPVSLGTTPESLTQLLERAWRELNPSGSASLDPDLELPPGELPKWSSHSLRRLADTVARRYRVLMEVTEDQIDIYFGWHEKILLRAMQVHYATLSGRERMRSARVTGML